MKVGSLFSGIGGLDLGLERAGMEISWMCEWAKHPRENLKKHWPGVHVYEDVRETRKPPKVDLVCGGFPCQDVSVAGKRRGLAGERTGLFYEAVRVLAETKPSWLVLENVPGLLSSNGGRDFAAVLEELGKLGYLCSWRVLDSKHFGVRQSRRRVFILGSLGNRAAWSFLDKAPIRDMQVGEEVGDGGAGVFFPTLTASYSADSYGAGRPYLLDWGNGEWTDRKSCGESNPKTRNRNYPSEESFLRQGCGDTGCTLARSRLTLPGPGEKSPCSLIHVSGTVFLVTSKCPKLTEPFGKTRLIGTEEGTEKLTRLFQEMGGGCLGLPDARLRALTPAEFEMLGGFPGGWTAGMPTKERYKAIGNSVVPQVAEWIGKRIMEIICGTLKVE